MNKKNVSGSSLHNSLPSHNKTVQPKTGLATFFGIGTEEIRKSIEALDRMLDQYDGGGGAQSDGGVDKKFAPKKVDPAAHLLASCMKSAGSHKLRKSTPSTGHEDDLPPPPPELLTIKRNVSLTETSSMESLKTDQAKCKAAPMKPKRDPDTKLSTSSNDSNVSFYQISRDEIHYDASMPFHNYNEKRHPESGYITPDQETIDSVFLVCHDRMSGLRVSSHQLNPGPVQQQQQQQPAAFRLSGDASIAQQVYLDRPTLDNSSFNNFPLLPPAEFGDGMASSMQPPSRGQLEDFSQKLPFGNPVVALSGQTRSSQAMTTNEGRIDSYPGYPTDRNPRDEYRRSSGQVVSDYQIPRRDIPPFREANHVESIHSDVMMQPSIISTSISPYLACVVPPPPPMPADFTLCSKNTDLLLDSINIVPPPLPLDLSPNEMHILPPAPLDFALPLAVDIGAESLPDQLPSPMKLPPPPTMPKQPKRGSPQSSLDVADDSASPNALPFKVNLKPVAAKTKTQPKPEPPVPEKTSDSHIYANLHTSHSTNFPAAPPPVFDAPSDFLPPPPPPPCPPPMNLNLSFPPPPPDPPDFFKFSSSVNNGSFPRPMLDMNSSSSKSSSLTQLSTSGNFPRLNGDSLALSLQSVQLRNIDNQEKQTSRSSPPDAHAALINQIQTGIQLKQSVHGAKIRGQSQEDQSKPDSIKSTGEKSEFMFEEAGHNSGSGTCSSPPAFSDFNSANFSAEMPLNRENSGSSQSSCPDQPVDITQLPGYQEIPSSCPAWKKALIEKKNKQLEEDAMKDFLARKQEEERWKDIPEWKRNLIIEKEKKKQDDLAPYQAERKRQEGESEWLQSLPEWKRTLIIKKRGDLP